MKIGDGFEKGKKCPGAPGGWWWMCLLFGGRIVGGGFGYVSWIFPCVEELGLLSSAH